MSAFNKMLKPRLRTLIYLGLFFLASLFVYVRYTSVGSTLPTAAARGGHIGQDTRGVLTESAVVAKVPAKDDESDFAKILRRQADSNGYIILASVDYGYIDMALNFYESSLKKLKLQNFLFVTSDSRASEALDRHNITNFNYFDDKDGESASKYASVAFARKTHYKTKIVLEALKLGLTVLISDVDIVLFKNPFNFLTCMDCDIQITSDMGSINSGFYLVRPTAGGIAVHQKAWDNALVKPKVSNQHQINGVIKSMQKDNTLKSLTMGLKQFPCGRSYFEDGQRMFAGDNPCKDCVMVHDNWIVGGDAKIYRLKEHLMWYVDTDGYYSNQKRKYISYENSLEFDKDNPSYEVKALKSALAIGHLLNRTVILPMFHCIGCQYNKCKNPRKRCALNGDYRIADFNKAFEGVYREHVFLQHSLVPKDVLMSQSDIIIIDNNLIDKQMESIADLVHFKPADLSKGASPAEILKWFDTEQYSRTSVLRFHSLYGSFSGLDDEHFNKRLDSSLKKSTSRQYK